MSTNKENQGTKEGAQKPTEVPVVKPSAKVHTGMLDKSLIPDGFKQIKAMPPKFLFRGDTLVFDKLTERDIKRMISFKWNNYLVPEKPEEAAKA